MMKIGLISDTHDNLPKIAQAVAFFNTQNVDLVLHAGDYVAPFTVPILDTLACDWKGVFGNNDGEKKGLADKSSNRITEGPLRIVWEHVALTLVHDINSIVLEKEKANIIVCGHTHKPDTKKFNSTLIVNPGECAGWLSGKSTLAIVDLKTRRIQIHTLP